MQPSPVAPSTDAATSPSATAQRTADHPVFFVADDEQAREFTNELVELGYRPARVDVQTDWADFAAELANASETKLAEALECAWLSGFQERKTQPRRRTGHKLLDASVLERLGVPERTQFTIDVEDEQTKVTLWVELDRESVARELAMPEHASEAAWLARVGTMLEVCLATVTGAEVDFHECERVAAMALVQASG